MNCCKESVGGTGLKGWSWKCIIKLQITFKYISFNVTELQNLGALSAMESGREKINECESHNQGWNTSANAPRRWPPDMSCSKNSLDT